MDIRRICSVLCVATIASPVNILILLATFLFFQMTIDQARAADKPAGLTARFAVTDIVGLEELQREFGKFQTTLEEKSGLHIEFFPVTSRNVVVEALRSGKVDFVLTGPAEYIVIHKRTNAKPIVRFSRPDYYSSIVVMAEENIESVDDLKGKKVAFGDVGSTSYHLGPMQLLKDYGLDPRNDITPVHISKHLGWEALKRGDVAALGIKQAQFEKFRETEKDLPAGAFRVIARGPDLPNDVLIAGAHVPDSTASAITEAFTKYSDEIIASILTGERNQKYHGMKFLAGVKDEDYNYVREMYATAGYPEYAEFIGNE